MWELLSVSRTKSEFQYEKNKLFKLKKGNVALRNKLAREVLQSPSEQ